MKQRFIKLLARLSEDAATRPGIPRNITDAAIRGDTEMVERFLQNGANIDERTIGFASPLSAAASNGQIDVVKLLLERGASLEPPNAMFPILWFAISNRRYEAVELVLLAGAPKDRYKDHLRLQAKSGDWLMVDALLAGGMDPSWLKEEELKKFENWRAAEGPRDEAWLQRRREKEAEARDKVLRQMVQGRRLSEEERAAEEDAAITLVQEHPSLATETLPSGTSVLGQAIKIRANRLALVLLDLGVEANPGGSPENTPLARAAAAGDLEMMERLLARGASPTEEACVAAAEGGSLEALKKLFENGAKLRAKARKSAIQLVCGPDEASIRQLLEKPTKGSGA